MNNLRYAVRLLLKSPGFALVAILTLALGIGVNSAIFSVVDAVMLQPLPYPEPDRLVSLWEENVGQGPNNSNTSGQNLGGGGHARMTVAAANLMDYRAQQKSFVSLAGFAVNGMNLTESGPPDRITGEQVTANYFATLGVFPAQGRAFLPEEDRPGANHVAIVSDELWHSRFGGDPHFLGSTITLDNQKYTVVGIMPAGFQSPSQFNSTAQMMFYVPAAYPADMLAHHADHEINVLGRLKPGVTIESARAELDAISAGLAQRYPDDCKNVKTGSDTLSRDISGRVRTSLFILLGAVGFILLVACANMANLLLVRAIGRQREIAIRFALGASRGRVIGELLAQSTVLAALGCVTGLIFGYWTQRLLTAVAAYASARWSVCEWTRAVVHVVAIGDNGIDLRHFPGMAGLEIEAGGSDAGERTASGRELRDAVAQHVHDRGGGGFHGAAGGRGAAAEKLHDGESRRTGDRDGAGDQHAHHSAGASLSDAGTPRDVSMKTWRSARRHCPAFNRSRSRITFRCAVDGRAIFERRIIPTPPLMPIIKP